VRVMGLPKRAQLLDAGQLRVLLRHVGGSRAPRRNRAIVLLAFRAGLRAIEIASLRWRMVTDVAGLVRDHIALENNAAKKQSGRIVPIEPETHAALAALHGEYADPDALVIRFRKGSRDRVIRSAAVQALFRGWFRALGFRGASSHSGRRTFATGVARRLPRVQGASIRDLQALLGHAHLSTTQRYIDQNPDAQRALVVTSVGRQP
jgi:integrase/recombinase XerD